jgi:hypothetical protein
LRFFDLIGSRFSRPFALRKSRARGCEASSSLTSPSELESEVESSPKDVFLLFCLCESATASLTHSGVGFSFSNLIHHIRYSHVKPSCEALLLS